MAPTQIRLRRICGLLRVRKRVLEDGVMVGLCVDFGRCSRERRINSAWVYTTQADKFSKSADFENLRSKCTLHGHISREKLNSGEFKI